MSEENGKLTDVPGHSERTEYWQKQLRSKGAFPVSAECLRRELLFKQQDSQRCSLLEDLRTAAASSYLYNTDDPILVDDSTEQTKKKRGGRRNRRKEIPCQALDGAEIGATTKLNNASKGTRRTEGQKTDDKESPQEFRPPGLRFTQRQLAIMRKFANYLVHPDTMVEIPPDLYTDWFCYVRPEGPRCLVLTDDGVAYVRAKNGRFMMRFATLLPSGSILDCVYVKAVGSKRLQSERDVAKMELEDESEIPMGDVSNAEIYRTLSAINCFHVLDVLCWNECYLVDSPMVCRHFFLRSRFDEMEQHMTKLSAANSKLFKPVNVCKSTPAELENLYSSDLGYKKDSIVFVHQEAQYIPGLNPLYLCWKDYHLSSWSVDSAAKEGVGSTSPIANRQQFCLELNRKGQLRTLEGLWGNVGKLSSDKAKVIFKNVESPKQSVLLKASAATLQIRSEGAAEPPHGLVIKFHKLQILSIAPAPRFFADSFNRIVYQHVLRREHLKRIEGGPSGGDESTETAWIEVDSDTDGGLDFDVLEFNEITLDDLLTNQR